MRICHLLLVGLLFGTLALHARADTIALPPTDDMYTDPEHPETPPEETELWVANYSGGCGTHRERTMIRFDISDVQDTVNDAVLHIYRCWRCPGDYYTDTHFRAITQDWDEETWPYTEHVPHEDTPRVQYTFGPDLGWYTINITDLVQAWVDGEIENYGLVIRAYSGEKCSRFRSKEHSNPAEHPYLEVDYSATGVADHLTVEGATHLVVANPIMGEATLGYRLKSPGPISMDIYDLRGRRIRNLVDHRWSQAGIHELTWDARDEACHRVPRGVFFCVFRTTNQVLCKKLHIVD